MNQKALCQDRDETTLKEDDSTLSVIRKRNVLSVYKHQIYLLTIVSNRWTNERFWLIMLIAFTLRTVLVWLWATPSVKTATGNTGVLDAFATGWC